MYTSINLTGTLNSIPDDYSAKILMLGGNGVGKTSLINRFTNTYFTKYTINTTGKVPFK